MLKGLATMCKGSVLSSNCSRGKERKRDKDGVVQQWYKEALLLLLLESVSATDVFQTLILGTT